MMSLSVFSSVASCVLLRAVVASADSFLGNQHIRTVSLQARGEELQAALGAVLGCTDGLGAQSVSQRVVELQDALLPVWRTLPKNQQGRVDWKVVRYVVHRHFMQRFGILVRGMEPTIQVNHTHSGEADILSSQAPLLAQRIAKGPQAGSGFLVGDAAAMVVALEQLIFTSERALLEKLYRDRGHDVHGTLGRKEVESIMTDYMVYWLMGEDEAGAAEAVSRPELLPEIVPHWAKVVSMAKGSVRAMEFFRQQSARPGTGHTVFHGQFTLNDVLLITGDISKSFAFFWDAQCQSTKESLVALDRSAAGRVRLPDFYGANKEGEWRFGESEAYLRELGSLDETSSWRGKQVIIPNYLQAASNCIATRSHYLVCCMNECEDIMGQLEEGLRTPVASPEDILQVLMSITNGDDEPAKTSSDVKRQLNNIAQKHGGKVPLHGRLFAQWLHYAFPRECPFPHRTGVAAAITPTQFGESFAVSTEEVNKHLADDVVRKDLELSSSSNASAAMEQWMTQWSEEEELIADYSLQLRQTIGVGPVAAVGGVAAAVLSLLWVRSSKFAGGVPAHLHSHFV